MKDRTGLIAACVLGVLMLPLVILLLVPKGNGGTYAKIESKLLPAVVEFNRQDSLELRLTATDGDGESVIRREHLWLSGEDWLQETVLKTETGETTILTLRYDGKLYRSKNGDERYTSDIMDHINFRIDPAQVVFRSWERQWNGAYTTFGMSETTQNEQSLGFYSKSETYEVDWRQNLRQVKTVMFGIDKTPKQVSVLEILSVDEKSCRSQIETAYADWEVP